MDEWVYPGAAEREDENECVSGTLSDDVCWGSERRSIDVNSGVVFAGLFGLRVLP